MKPPIRIAALAACCMLAASGCQDNSRSAQKLSDTMTCGQSTFTVISTCVPADEAYALNACQPQELQVKSGAGLRKVALPEMTAAATAAIRKSGRDPATMFVTEFGCTAAHGANVAVLYYSAGTSPGPRSEAWVEYHENGVMRGKDEPALTREHMAALDAGMRQVRSILPADPVTPK